MGYDVGRIRMRFPALSGGTAHFDGPGGSQTPDTVVDAVASTLSASIANRGRVTASERYADTVVGRARAALAGLLGADVRGVVFGRSMTQLTYDFARTLAKDWGPGDEVVVSRLDHDANIRPWVQAGEAVGATVRWAEFDPETTELATEDVAAVLSERTRLVAVTAASNVLGTRPDVTAIGRLAHDAGALLYVDAVHATPHAPIDMRAMGADFLACSPYKFLGPHCGVVAGRPELLESLRPDKLLPATDAIPERFERGTLPYELMAGTTAAVEFLAGLDADASGSRRERVTASMRLLQEYEDSLLARLEAELTRICGVEMHSRARTRTPTLWFSIAGHEPSDVHRFLAERQVNAPAGHFYALEAARRMGLAESGAVRAGLAPYTDDSDIDRLLDGIRALVG